MLHSILHEACERVGTLDELMDAMNPKDGYEMRLFIQTPGRQFAFYRIPERLSNLEDYANEGCSVRGTKDEIMAEIFTEWAPPKKIWKMTLNCDSPHFSFHLYLPAPCGGAPQPGIRRPRPAVLG